MANETINKLESFFEEQGFIVSFFEQNNEICAEIEKWTDGGVDMIIVLNPFTKESFIEYVNEFDVDDEIDLHRQDVVYKTAFTIRESVKDFTNFHKGLKKVVKLLNKLK